MGLKKTILRIANGIEPDEAFKNNLKEMIGDYEIEHYSSRVDLGRSYQQRIDSLYKAFLLIMKVIPMRSDTDYAGIMAFSKYSYETMSFANCYEIGDYKKKLTNYTIDLLNTIIAIYKWPADEGYGRYQYAIDLLDKADCYVAMQEGRADLATLLQVDSDATAASSSSSEKKFTWVLLYDQQQFPFEAETMSELACIKQRGQFLTPSWFRNMPAWLQSFFCKTDQLSTNITSLKLALNAVALRWKGQYKGMPETIEGDLQLIAKVDDMASLPDWFRCVSSEEQRAIIKNLVHASITSKDFTTRLHQLSSVIRGLAFNNYQSFADHLVNLRVLPYWYLLLPEDEQRLLKFSLHNTSDNLYDAVSFLPSRLRTLPGLANLAKHFVKFLDVDGNPVKSTPERIRSAHIGSRAVINLPPEIAQLHAKRNLAHVLSFSQSGPALIQTLISPDWTTHRLVGTPDYPLYYQLAEAIKAVQSDRQIFYPNHPYNALRYVYLTYASDAHCNALLKYAEEFFADSLNHVNPNGRLGRLSEEALRDLECLIKEYRDLINSEPGSATWKELWSKRGRELSLSSVEHLLTMQISGLPYSSCVSGKDRNGINIDYTDSMLIYRELYGFWPSFKDSEPARTRFMMIFATLINSRHIDEHAAQNAPGATGIKHPFAYMPGDAPVAIYRALGLTEPPLANQCPLAISDILASTNDVEEIVKAVTVFDANLPVYQVAAQKLSEVSRERFLDVLWDNISNAIFWQEQRKNRYTVLEKFISRSLGPQGIEELKVVFKDRPFENSMTILARIYQTVEQRPAKDGSRSDSTQVLYDAIGQLKQAESPEKIVVGVMGIIRSIIPAEASCSSSDLSSSLDL